MILDICILFLHQPLFQYEAILSQLLCFFFTVFFNFNFFSPHFAINMINRKFDERERENKNKSLTKKRKIRFDLKNWTKPRKPNTNHFFCNIRDSCFRLISMQWRFTWGFHCCFYFLFVQVVGQDIKDKKKYEIFILINFRNPKLRRNSFQCNIYMKFHIYIDMWQRHENGIYPNK